MTWYWYQIKWILAHRNDGICNQWAISFSIVTASIRISDYYLSSVIILWNHIRFYLLVYPRRLRIPSSVHTGNIETNVYWIHSRRFLLLWLYCRKRKVSTWQVFDAVLAWDIMGYVYLHTNWWKIDAKQYLPPCAATLVK